MANKIGALNWQTPIVDTERGTPTNFFIRIWQDMFTNAESVLFDLEEAVENTTDIQASISELNTSVDDINTEIVALKNYDTNNETDKASILARLDTIEDNIVTINSTLTTYNTRITNLENRVTALEGA